MDRLSQALNFVPMYMSTNGITRVTMAPYVTTAHYYPSSNGLAQMWTQIHSLEEQLAIFLFTYCITPRTTIGISPAELLMCRKLCSRFDKLFPDLQQQVHKKQMQQSARHDNSKPLRDLVYTKNSSTPLIWVPGTIVKVTGPLSY